MSTVTLEEGTFVQVDPELITQAEDRLSNTGFSYSKAIELFTKNIIRNGLQLEAIGYDKPPVPCLEDLTDDEFDAMIQEAFDSIETEGDYSIDEVMEDLGID